MALGYKLFGGLISVVLLIWLVSYFWVRPERWNATAATYKVERDSLREELPVLVRLNATKDSVIADISGRWQQAIAYGDKWKADLNAQYQVSDALAARLSAADREQANYSGLQQNGTLDKGIDPKTLTPADGRVVLANLQTVQRQAAGVKALDSVGRVIGVLTTKTDRLGGVLKRTDATLARVDPVLQKAEKKAKLLGFIKTKNSKAIAAVKDSVAKARREITSELKNELNKSY